VEDGYEPMTISHKTQKIRLLRIASFFSAEESKHHLSLHHGLFSSAEWKTTQPEVTTGN